MRGPESIHRVTAHLEDPLTTSRRSRLAASALTVAAALVAALAAAPPASAASDYLRYAGQNLNMARVPAAVVTIDAFSATPARSATFSVDGRVLATDTTLVPEGSRWLASSTVDLSGLHGVTKLTVRFDVGKYSRPFWKYFRAIPPTTPGAPGTLSIPTGMPGPDSTGVPAGTTLRPSGPLTIRQAGAVVDGLDVDGCVDVRASGVTIRNTRIRCDNPVGGLAVAVGSGGKGLTLESVEVDGRGTSGVCVGWGEYTLRKVDLHGCADGARFGNRVTVEDSWIHDLARIGTLHPDALQTTSGSDVVVRHNTLDARSSSGDFGNAALMLGSELGAKRLTRVVVERNFLDGGNYALNVRGDINASSVTIRDNTFGDGTRYGPVIVPARVPLGSGNVYAATGGPVRVVRP